MTTTACTPETKIKVTDESLKLRLEFINNQLRDIEYLLEMRDEADEIWEHLYNSRRYLRKALRKIQDINK